MKTTDFDYHLPPDRIAQRPAKPRDSSRLLAVDRATGRLSHHAFLELPDLLASADLLVANSTRVIPARLTARKASTGGKAEILLLRQVDDLRWEALVGGRGLGPGARLALQDGPEARVIEDRGGAQRLIEFSEPIGPWLERLGAMPLPPYIKAPLEHPDEYQTIFAREAGSAAAPTAGLHFTRRLLEALEARGIRLVEVTLHVGLDTFAPVISDDPSRHPIHREWCRVPKAVADAALQARSQGGRVVAIGTTTVRSLETAAQAGGASGLEPYEGFTDLFILPGYEFLAVDAMVTNFHLPRSSLLMLVSAFAGKELILHAYKAAIREGYRFYSFGDAMLIL